MKVKVTARSISTSLGILRLEDVVDLPQDEVNKIMKMNPAKAFEKMPETPVFKSAKKKAPAKKKRARNKDGTLKADDPSTPENEAWTDA